ncbi:MAG: hypothetical protein JWO09_1468 [Bacteroidetes bacterium]|nr:hypothetical protein [Bacteroidota bacterium]
MKRGIRILLAVAFLAGTAGVESCTKEKQEDIAYNLATSYINKGKWKVGRFEEDGKDETGHFSGYVFQFNTDGTVTATNGNNAVKGTWATNSDGSKTKMNINFATAPLNELNDDWVIKSGGTGSIQLQHTSGGDGSVDYLTFDKI